MPGVHSSVIFFRILASFGVTFSQRGCNVSHFNYLEVMKSNCCFFERLFELQEKWRFTFLYVHLLLDHGYHFEPDPFLFLFFFLFFFFDIG